jgi:hypothetical protein
MLLNDTVLSRADQTFPISLGRSKQ